MTDKISEYSTLKLPSFLRGFLKLYFNLRTMKIRKKEVVRLRALEEAIDTIKNEYECARKNGENDKMSIFNISLFTLVVEYDVSSLKFMILYQMDKWNKQFLGRQLAVLMYESTDDFLVLLGKDFRKMINDLHEKEILTQRLNEITKELNEFKKKNMLLLQEIRNYCGAHRDKNAYQQLMIISNIETNDLLGLTAEFMIPVSKLTPYFSGVVNAMIDKTKAHNRVDG